MVGTANEHSQITLIDALLFSSTCVQVSSDFSILNLVTWWLCTNHIDFSPKTQRYSSLWFLSQPDIRPPILFQIYWVKYYICYLSKSQRILSLRFLSNNFWILCIFFPFTNINNTKYSQTTVNIEFTKHVVFIVQQRFICNLCQLLVVVFKFERILLGFINIITLISIFIFHIALINHYNNCDYKYICNYDFVCWCLTVESYMVAERVCINNIKHYGW